MKLINCDSRQLVAAAEGAAYVALSYCWGDVQSSCTEYDYEDLINAPQTIEDAIQVTLELNYIYLWVDRYCIPQEDEQLKAEQIAFMGEIYANADVTIIAAGGDNSDSGLPGISSPRITGQWVSRSCSQRVVTVESVPVEDITESAWNTRGWTFQEGHLSTRRLAFTRSQVFFQCQIMSSSECIDPIHSRGFRNDQLSQMNLGSFFETWASHGTIWELITEFTRRRLRYSHDTLNAILGVLERFSNSTGRTNTKRDSCSESHFRHLAGLPLLRSDDANGRKQSWEEKILTALQWSRIFTPRKALSRNHEFPSWCWTGFVYRDRHKFNAKANGPRIIPSANREYAPQIMSIEAEHHIVLACGGKDLEDKVNNRYMPLSMEARFLRIKAVVLKVHASEGVADHWQWPLHSHVQFGADMNENGLWLNDTRRDGHVPLHPSRFPIEKLPWTLNSLQVYKCIILDAKFIEPDSLDRAQHLTSWGKNKGDDQRVTALFVRQVDDYFERLAVVKLWRTCAKMAEPMLQEIMLG